MSFVTAEEWRLMKGSSMLKKKKTVWENDQLTQTNDPNTFQPIEKMTDCKCSCTDKFNVRVLLTAEQTIRNMWPVCNYWERKLNSVIAEQNKWHMDVSQHETGVWQNVLTKKKKTISARSLSLYCKNRPNKIKKERKALCIFSCCNMQSVFYSHKHFFLFFKLNQVSRWVK